MSFYKYTFISVSIYKHIHIKPWVLILPYFFNYKMHSPPKLGRKMGVHLIVRMQLTWLTAMGEEGGSTAVEPGFFFFLFYSSKTQVRLMVWCVLQSEKCGNLWVIIDWFYSSKFSRFSHWEPFRVDFCVFVTCSIFFFLLKAVVCVFFKKTELVNQIFFPFLDIRSFAIVSQIQDVVFSVPPSYSHLFFLLVFQFR